MANIAKALKEEIQIIGNRHQREWAYPTGSAWVDPSGSGSYSFMGLEEVVTVGHREVYLICRGCGKKFLFQKEKITSPLFEMTCTCGTILEFEKEKE